jgi:hypothetical protein
MVYNFLLWKPFTMSKQNKPKISPETIALMRKMAKENHWWGAEWMCGKLLKLGI